MKSTNSIGTKHGIVTENVLSYLEHGTPTRKRDSITIEEPLQIVLRSHSIKHDVAVIMRTPVMDFELAVGFLYSEGIITGRDDILSISYDKSREKDWQNVVLVDVVDTVKIPERTRNFTMNSSCGLCGKTVINDIYLKGKSIIKLSDTVSRSIVFKLPQLLMPHQDIFHETGGIHAAGLFDFLGNLIVVGEDVGRHNAVDKIVGYMLIHELVEKEEYILQVSGRTGFEIVQKAVGAGIPVICSVSAPSSLAVETAETFGATLACFIRDGKFNVYSHPERLAD